MTHFLVLLFYSLYLITVGGKRKSECAGVLVHRVYCSGRVCNFPVRKAVLRLPFRR